MRGRKDSSELPQSVARRRSSVTFREAPNASEVTVVQRSLSNPAISGSKSMISRLERRRSAVTFPSTYRSLNSASTGRSKSTSSTISATSNVDVCCYNHGRGLWSHKGREWAVLGNYFRQPQDEKRLSVNQIRIRKSLEKAIQKAGYNMNEIVTSSNRSRSPDPQRKPFQTFTEVDWSETAVSDHHIWSPCNASGDLCYVGEKDCQKSGSRMKCNVCHIVIHEQCFQQLVKIGFGCKVTFREPTSRNNRETLIVHHHWVHRRKMDGKCKQCGKSFEKRFGFRESTKIIAISCSWCKEAYHNKVSCFQMHKINEPCTLGSYGKLIVPPTWIIKTSKQKSLRNRSKKKKTPGGTWRVRSSKENRSKTFIVRPLSHQAAFICPTLIFINPKSGGQQGGKLLHAMQWILSPRQVFDLSKGGPREGLELYRKVPNLRVLACGGDGTVGWILSVLDKLNMSRPPPVAILPLGTGNDLSRTLNFGPGYTDESIHKILQGVEEARMVKLDRWKLIVEKNEDAVKIVDEDENQGSIGADGSNGDGVDKLPLDVINNYFGIGSDAQVTLNFHESREMHPAKFNSRFVNKLQYARASVEEFWTRHSKDLSKHISVVCDGVDITKKIRDLKPVCILFLNIPRYSSGTSPWGNPTGNEFRAQRHDDRLIEVLAFSINQLGMIFVGGHGERLCQCKSAYIRTSKVFPVQIDGEPCKLNPSNITLQFHNQASMLYKSKRRSSIVTEPQPSHEQIKVWINKISLQDFDAFNGKKEHLCQSSSPVCVVVLMNQSTLDLVRSNLCDSESSLSSFSSHSDNWIFLESNNQDKFYKIDRNQESLLSVSDVVSKSNEIFILDVSETTMQGFSAFPRSQHIDKQFRNRVRSESGVLKSSSESFTSLTRSSVNEEANITELSDDDENPPTDPSSSTLDVVFEHPEVAETVKSNGDNRLTNDVTLAKPPLITTTGPTSQSSSADVTKPITSSTVTSLRQNESRCESDCSSYSTSSNEYILSDDVTNRSKKSPLRLSHSNPPSSEQAHSSDQHSKPSNNEKKKKTHKRSNTDTTPSKTATSLSPPTNIKHTLINRNYSNNVDLKGSSQEKENVSETDGVFLDDAHKLSDSSSDTLADDDNDDGGGDDVTNYNKMLLDASKRGNLEKVIASLENGANILACDAEGLTSLHNAARFAYSDVMDYLIEQDEPRLLNMLCHDRKQTALHKAAWYGRTEICKKLVDSGASIHIKDNKGKTVLDQAKLSGEKALIDLITDLEQSNLSEAIDKCPETDL